MIRPLLEGEGHLTTDADLKETLQLQRFPRIFDCVVHPVLEQCGVLLHVKTNETPYGPPAKQIYVFGDTELARHWQPNDFSTAKLRLFSRYVDKSPNGIPEVFFRVLICKIYREAEQGTLFNEDGSGKMPIHAIEFESGMINIGSSLYFTLERIGTEAFNIILVSQEVNDSFSYMVKRIHDIVAHLATTIIPGVQLEHYILSHTNRDQYGELYDDLLEVAMRHINDFKQKCATGASAVLFVPMMRGFGTKVESLYALLGIDYDDLVQTVQYNAPPDETLQPLSILSLPVDSQAVSQPMNAPDTGPPEALQIEVKYFIQPTHFTAYYTLRRDNGEDSTLGDVLCFLKLRINAFQVRNTPIFFISKNDSVSYDRCKDHILSEQDTQPLSNWKPTLNLYVDFLCASCPQTGTKYLTPSPNLPCHSCKQLAVEAAARQNQVVRVIANEISLHSSSFTQFTPLPMFKLMRSGFLLKKRKIVLREDITLCDPLRRFAGMTIRQHSVDTAPTIHTQYEVRAMVSLCFDDVPIEDCRPDTHNYCIKPPTVEYAEWLQRILKVKNSVEVLEILCDTNGNLYAKSLLPDFVNCYVGTNKQSDAPYDLISSSGYSNLFCYDKFRFCTDNLYTVLYDFRDSNKLELSHNQSLCVVAFNFKRPNPGSTGFSEWEAPPCGGFSRDLQYLLIQSNVSVDYFNRRKLLFYEKQKLMDRISYDYKELARLSAESQKASQAPRQ